MNNLAQTQANFNYADHVWSVELQGAFGKEAGTARYQLRGQGKPGTVLALAYEARQIAMQAWEDARAAAGKITG